MKSHHFSFLLLTAVIAFLFLLTGCAKTTHAVTYEVGGSAADIAISYRNATNALVEANVAPPWSESFTAESLTRVVINARNRTNTGTVSCKIVVDGEVVTEGESSGAFKLVRCEFFIPAPTITPGSQ